MELTKKNCMIAKNRMRGLAYASCNCREENIDEVNNCDNYLEQLINEHFDNLSLNKTGEEMLFKLGFRVEENGHYDNDNVVYRKIYPKTRCKLTIAFDLELEEVFMELDDKRQGIPLSLDVEEVKAVVQMMSDLGWLE